MREAHQPYMSRPRGSKPTTKKHGDRCKHSSLSQLVSLVTFGACKHGNGMYRACNQIGTCLLHLLCFYFCCCRCRLALFPLAAPSLAATTILSRPSLAPLLFCCRRFISRLSRGQ